MISTGTLERVEATYPEERRRQILPVLVGEEILLLPEEVAIPPVGEGVQPPVGEDGVEAGDVVAPVPAAGGSSSECLNQHLRG